MPLGAVADAALGAIAEFVSTVFMYGTARVVVPLLTLGRVRVERKGDEDALRFGWLGFARDANGRMVMATMLASLIGALWWVAVIVILYFLLR